MAKITTTKIKNKKDNDTPETTEQQIHQKIDIAARWIEKNSKAIAMGFGLFLLACGAYILWNYVSNQQAMKHFDQAFEVEKSINKVLTAQESAIAEAEKPDDKKDKKKDEEVKPKAPDEAQVSSVTSEVKNFVTSYPSSNAARNLSIKWVSYLYDQKKYNEALDVLDKLKPGKDTSLDGLSNLVKASTLTQTGRFQEAIQIYKEIISTKKWNFIHPEAQYQMSLALVEDNNEAAAIENLKEIKEKYPDQQKMITDSLKLLRWLQYKKSQGE